MNIQKLAAITAAACLLSSCASNSIEPLTISESRHSHDGFQEKQYSGKDATALLRKLSPFADLAEAAYRRDFDGASSDIAALARIEHGCDYVASGDASIVRLGLPADWVRLDDALIKKFSIKDEKSNSTPLLPCRSKNGLNYETYIKLDSAGKPLLAAISFRGTENTKYQWKEDWVANFSYINFGIGDNPEYHAAREEGARLVKALAHILPKTNSSAVCRTISGKDQNVQAPIYLVGHSLGGGLAQHLAFYSDACDVKETITFDSSPATGWFYLHERHEIKTKDPVISRVYLDNEALSFVRKISTKFNFVRDFRVDYKVDFPGLTHNTFGLHSMTLLATNIKIGAADPTIEDSDSIASIGSSTETPQPPNSR